MSKKQRRAKQMKKQAEARQAGLYDWIVAHEIRRVFDEEFLAVWLQEMKAGMNSVAAAAAVLAVCLVPVVWLLLSRSSKDNASRPQTTLVIGTGLWVLALGANVLGLVLGMEARWRRYCYLERYRGTVFLIENVVNHKYDLGQLSTLPAMIDQVHGLFTLSLKLSAAGLLCFTFGALTLLRQPGGES